MMEKQIVAFALENGTAWDRQGRDVVSSERLNEACPKLPGVKRSRSFVWTVTALSDSNCLCGTFVVVDFAMDSTIDIAT